MRIGPSIVGRTVRRNSSSIAASAASWPGFTFTCEIVPNIHPPPLRVAAMLLRHPFDRRAVRGGPSEQALLAARPQAQAKLESPTAGLDVVRLERKVRERRFARR